MPAKIKHIIFDLGGVLLNIDPNKTLKAFQRLAVSDLNREKQFTYEHSVFSAMEQGKITSDEFREGIQNLLPIRIAPHLIDEAWNAMLLDFIAERITLVNRLHKHYKVYLFSNTNAIHQHHFHQLFFKKYNYAMSALFDEDFYSHELGLRKPKTAAFEKVLKLADIVAEETLFIDDLNENCLAAKQVGLQTLCLAPTDDLEQKLKDLFAVF
ncbi:MAG: HAD family hydrolase [Mangrovibacterium sp.]